ncbi:hypothetical protein [Agarilytica rhodophyticola]|uniref:hypothetical protein n=1 Tax=Agarilytica rhodophyticola TaxID=1737490 RepID=UPI000B3461B5|nr:hypothetical protein [Agarilytica rhodophyticola]
MDNIKPVSDSELEYINSELTQVNINVSMSMAYIRKTQGWSYTDLERHFTKISGGMWKRYLQPSYNKMRPIHVVAAYSWLTMVPMPSFYRGLKIKESYRGMDNYSVKALIHCGILPKKQFSLLLTYIYDILNSSQKASVDALISEVRQKYGSLDDYDDNQFLFPEVLDMDMFAYDYYRSIALAFRNFREQYNLKASTVAKILNLSKHRYAQCEDPDNPVVLPVEIAARLKLGFHLTDAMSFTSYMEKYPQFHTVRLVQHIRETKLVELMSHITRDDKDRVVAIIINMAQIYVKSLQK